MPNIFKTKC